MIGQRYIRLKEIPPLTNRMETPQESYRSFVDETLERGPFRCRSDDNGFIITGNKTATDSDCLIFLGDSFVESIFSHEQSRFVSAVERELAAAGTPRCCLNGGYSGSTSLQLVNVLLNKVYPLVGSAGTVLFFVPQSDVKLLDDSASYWTSAELYAPILPPVAASVTELKPGLENTRKLLQIAVSMARTLGMNLVLVTSPFRSAPHGDDEWLAGRLRGDTYKRLLSRRENLVQTVESVATSARIPLIDAASYMRDRPDCFYDELHLNARGQEVFSLWLARAIRELPAAPSSLTEAG